MILSKLLESIASLLTSGTARDGGIPPKILADQTAAIDIGSLHCRAQEVKPGGLFVAIRGHAADGHDYIEVAVENGAAAVVVEKAVSTRVPTVVVRNSRTALAALAAAFYGRPSESMVLVGITGTNGKTTVSYLVEAMLEAAGHRTGVIGTVNYRYAGNAYKNPVTTPESLDLQRILAEMRTAGVTHAVLEVSSHGIDLHRVDHCWIDVGVFTNLTQDHLDYHETIESYWNCKKRLFTEILSTGPKQGRTRAVINTNDPRGRELLDELDLPCISVGGRGMETVASIDVQSTLAGNRGRLMTPGGALDFNSALVGRHNLENILCAVGAALAVGLELPAIGRGLAAVRRVPGRLDPVPNNRGRHVYVDYAHTPDALKNVLTSLRDLSDNRIVCVFGCGGDRDRNKRPQMGRFAARGSHLAVVTSDNPRSESPTAIINEILPGVVEVLSHRYSAQALPNGFDTPGYTVEPDRGKAIELALTAAAAEDTVLIAGKGHEDYQVLADRTIHFDDRRVAQHILSRLEQMPDKPDPTNPASAPPVDPDWCIADVLDATGGYLLSGDADQRFSGIQIDSRRIGPQDIFVAIVGENHDGHEFAAEVIRQGVRGLIVHEARKDSSEMQTWCRPGVAVVCVPDTTRALGDLAGYHRRRMAIPVVAITGSNGKTTTREMTAAVVSRRLNTHSTKKNYNNHIGLPLTILETDSSHECAVVELGMNAPGEIDRLAQICTPDIGVITNIGRAHLEGVGSIEGVLRAKAELLPRIKKDGRAILNADDHRLRGLAEQAPVDVVLYGTRPPATIRADSIRMTAAGSEFVLHLDDRQVDVSLPVAGRFMVSNALAAAAAGWRLGVSAEDIAAGLAAFRPVSGRNVRLQLANGVNLIDDTYNANPGSMQAALDLLQALSQGSRSLLVVGDMLELGTQKERLHRRLGERVARSGIGRLYAAGQMAVEVARGALDGGMRPDDVFTGAKSEIGEKLTSDLRPGDWVLIKGSRGMRMEEVVETLKSWADKST